MPLWMLTGPALVMSDRLPAQAQLTTTETVAAPVTTPTQRHIVLRLDQRRVDLYQDKMLISSYPVAVGTPETPTPSGEFTVSKMVVDPV